MKQSKFKFLDSIKSNAKLNNEKDITYYQAEVATIGALIIVVSAFILVSILMPFSFVNILSGECLIVLLFDVFFAEKFFGVKFKNKVDIFCAISIMISALCVWFTAGGLNGLGSFMMIFAMVYCMHGIRGRAKYVLSGIFGYIIVGIVILSLIKPELINTQGDSPQRTLLRIFGLIGVSLYNQITVTIQNKQMDADRKRLFDARDNLTNNFNQSLAVNEELNVITQKLENVNRTQRSFNASMNHELRAPLNGIEGCLQILMLDESLSVEAKETVKNALTASKTINQTVNDILDYAKLEEGKFEIVNKEFDLRDVLDNISTIFKPQANAKNLKFIIQIPTETRVSLVADGVRIQQVMTNLISNGIKYTKEGSVTLTVTTQRGHLNFSVEDTGQGMSKENLDVLFDPFTRFNLDQNVQIQGTGLGMNIVHNMVKQMNGEIKVESTVNVGTKFYVDIPIMYYDSYVTLNSEREKTAIKNKDINLDGVRVLCVDDTEINRAVFKGLLKNTNAKVTSVDCGSRAVKLCSQVMFDIVFLDHMMPEMDGIETLHEIRNLPDNKYKDVPIIMFTGNAGDEYKTLYKENGADGYLIKPIMYDDLIDCFNKINKDKENE